MHELTPEARKLINYLHRGGQAGYYWQSANKQSTWFDAGTPPNLPACDDVYFGIHPTSQKGSPVERSKNKTITAVNCLFAEFDAKDHNGDKSATLAHVQALIHPPSVVIDSGGGYHCYWLLRDPVEIRTPEGLEIIRKMQAEWVEYTGGDGGAKDLARVLRVPGTNNRKYTPHRPVMFVWADYDQPYTLGEFDNILANAARGNGPKQPQAEPKQRPSAPGGGDNPADYWLQRALEQAAEGKRNAMGFWLACQLRDSGLSESEARTVQYPERVSRGTQPYTREEWETSVKSAYDHPARTPAQGKGSKSAYHGGQPEGHALAESEPHYTDQPAKDEGQAITPALDVLAEYPGFETVKRALDESETGDAELLAALYADKIRFDHSMGEWYLWEGHNWQPDKKREVYRLVSKGAAPQYLQAAAEAQAAENANLAKELVKRAAQLRTKKRADNVLSLATAIEKIALVGDEWDQNPWLIGVENGVINLKTGDFSPGQPADHIRAHTPTPWQGIDAPAERWQSFVSELFDGDSELSNFLQRLLGYGLTGLTSEHILPILWGEGRNGKSTLLETLGAVLGADLATSSQADALMDTRSPGEGPKPFVYALRGKRIVWASESNEGRRINASLVKQLTGGDRLNVRTLHSKPVEFAPNHLLLLLTNHRPHISADDQAVWDRIHLIPFTQRFVESPTAVNEHKADKALSETLRREAPGILAWLVRGCLEWQQVGLKPPAVVRETTEEYRNEEDDLRQFVAEMCVLAEGAKVQSSVLYAAYAEWCKAGGLSAMNRTAFGRRMKKRFNHKTSQTVFYLGLGLAANPI